MTTLAVTGHMDLTVGSLPLIRASLDTFLAAYRGSDLVGVSCLARGADSLFAQAVLRAGGRVIAVIPSQDYRDQVVADGDAALFDHLLEASEEVVVLPYGSANRQAYEAANAELLRRADRLVAVWNGEPPGGRGGGTADMVLAARAAAVPVDVVWPQGAERVEGGRPGEADGRRAVS